MLTRVVYCEIDIFTLYAYELNHALALYYHLVKDGIQFQRYHALKACRHLHLIKFLA